MEANHLPAQPPMKPQTHTAIVSDKAASIAIQLNVNVQFNLVKVE